MKKGLHILTFLLVCTSLSAQLTADAGTDFTVCPPSESRVLGGSPSATGGVPPYVYQWQPSTGLSSTSAPNPTVTANSNIQYTLTVTDAILDISVDYVTIFLDSILKYDAGRDTGLCVGNTSGVQIGNPLNASATSYSFSWQLATTLNSSVVPNPIATPTSITIYTLTVTHGTCTAQTETVKVTPYFVSLYLAFRDTVIKEGTTITLFVSGGTSYQWFPQNNYIKYATSANPDVNPLKTITYTVTGLVGSCVASDTVRVRVTPSDELVFYTAFTPNGDGDNDFFYIGNLGKYPDNILKGYNRYGQVIFISAQYNNDWDGTYQGNQIPTGTYFYVFDTGTDKGKYKGTVTIIR